MPVCSLGIGEYMVVAKSSGDHPFSVRVFGAARQQPANELHVSSGRRMRDQGQPPPPETGFRTYALRGYGSVECRARPWRRTKLPPRPCLPRASFLNASIGEPRTPLLESGPPVARRGARARRVQSVDFEGAESSTAGLSSFIVDRSSNFGRDRRAGDMRRPVATCRCYTRVRSPMRCR